MHEFVVDVELVRVDQTVRAEKMNSEIPTSEEKNCIGLTPLHLAAPLGLGQGARRRQVAPGGLRIEGRELELDELEERGRTGIQRARRTAGKPSKGGEICPLRAKRSAPRSGTI